MSGWCTYAIEGPQRVVHGLLCTPHALLLLTDTRSPLGNLVVELTSLSHRVYEQASNTAYEPPLSRTHTRTTAIQERTGLVEGSNLLLLLIQALF